MNEAFEKWWAAYHVGIQEKDEYDRWFSRLVWEAATPQWQPIETSPKDATKILISDGKDIDMAYWDYADWCAPHSTSNPVPIIPTHWQPLPIKPNE